MIRKEIDRNKRSKHFPTSTFVGNNRQMLQEIRDSLSHLSKVQPADFRNDNMQLKLDLTPTASNIGDIRSGVGKMTRSGHGSGYHQKALAEIRDSLLPFANENGINGNFGRETGHEREVQVNRVMLHHLINMGYDEEISSKALKLCGNKSLDAAQDAILKMVSHENKSERVNGMIQTGSSGYPGFVCKMVSRSPGESSPSGSVAFNSNNREINLAISNPTAIDNSNPRPASPGMSLQPRPFTEAWMFSYPGESRNHPPVSRQYSPSHGETPPPPPPRTQPPPPTPPPIPQMDFRPVQPPSTQQLTVISSSAPQILKRMSPIPQTTRPQGAGYTASPSQSSTPQRGMSPVSSSRQQNNHLTQQITSLTLYQNAASSSDAPPPYCVSQTNSVAAMISKFSTPPPPYAAAPQTRQSPPQPGNNEFNPLTKRPTITNYHTPLTLNLKSASPGNCPITTLSMATTSGNLQPAPVQAWRQAKAQSPIIMQSVRSTQVQKPVLQTAVAPTSPPISANLTSLPTSNNKVGGTFSALTYTSPQTTSSPTTIINTPTTSSNNDILIASSPSYTTNIHTQSSTYCLTSSSPEAFTTNTTTTIQAQSGQVVTVQSTLAKPIPNASPQQKPNCIVKSKHYVQTETQSPCNTTLQHLPLQRRISPALPETQNSTPRSDSPVSHATSQSPVSVVSTASSPSTNSDPPPDLRSPPPPYTTRHHSPMPERKAQSREKEEERRETKVRNYSPQAFKFFMEQHVENLLKSHQQRVHRRMQLETEMAKVGLSEEAQLQMRRMLHQKESNYIRLKRAKMDKSQFLKIKTIGIGAFGEVALVRKIDTNQLYAMKTLRKVHVLTRNQVAHVKAERDILAEADNEWVVKLYYSFQDTDHLYFVMDYVPGGDMMSLLIKFGIFQEPLARFYIAELVCAIESVHKMGFIHRDIKPDNILIDRDGHIKLTDFGLCTGFRWTHNSKYYQKNGEHNRQDSMDLDETWDNDCRCEVSSKPLERRKRREHQRCLAHSLVGTPNYIAPEVLKRTGYTQLCDWWSVGVILYEMLVGQPPFLANSPAETQYKVINWETTLRIPKQAKLSPEATDLILQLCCGPEKRLGCRNGAPDIKSHPFFQVIAWDSGLRRQPAPYFPCIRYATDTSNFDPVDPDKLRESGSSDDGQRMDKGYENGKHPEHAFFEFTFRRFFDDGGHAYPTRSRDMDQGPVYV